ncbi:ArsR family transcriptional regulator [Halobacteriales archaeon QH_10_67_22]|nr:MAG: ArsR family transcriptional regulator [Halobacteriales archaeon QH_10_67_22]
MSEDDILGLVEEVIEEFDFGSYEVDAYLALLENGELTATEVASLTDVPQPRVYDTVRSLEDRGLVEIHESRPMRIVARKPEEAFAAHQQLFDEMVSELDARYATPARTAEAVSVIRSRTTIQRYVEEIVETAEYELTLSLTPALLDRFEPALARAIEADVTTTLLVTPAADAPDPDEFAYERVTTHARARRGVVTPVIAVADGEYAMYATQDALREGNDNYAVIFNRSALGFLLVGFFRTVLWTTAEELSSVESEGGFPRRYASVRQCIDDIGRARTDLYATVTGRRVLTGDPCEVRGEIAKAEITDESEVATLVLATDDGEVTVGGRVATYEDVEAHEIRVTIGSPPDI